MKRLVLTTTGTIAGLAALLSFKTQSQPIASAAPLPSAGTSATGTTSPTGSTAAPSSSGASSSAAPNTATVAKKYVGQAVTTRYGIVQVEATVAGSRITDVAFVQLTAFDPHSQEINSFAGPQLLQETLTHQSAQVDTISGASYTSDGYRQSMQSALDQAGLR